MINFFSRYKIFFYLTTLMLIFLYLFPGSLFGCIFFNNCKVQPQITSDFIVSSNHFYAFGFVAIIGYLTYLNTKKLKLILIFLILLSIILELFHLLIPERSFQWPDLFGNLLGVVVVISFCYFIKIWKS